MSWLENAEWILQYVFSIMSSYQQLALPVADLHLHHSQAHFIQVVCFNNAILLWNEVIPPILTA